MKFPTWRVVVDAAAEICLRQVAERYGQPWHHDVEGRWERTNFPCLEWANWAAGIDDSSDVDVLFVYRGRLVLDHAARDKAPRAISANHQFFNRVAEALIAEISRSAPEGTLSDSGVCGCDEGDAPDAVRWAVTKIIIRNGARRGSA